MEKEEISKEMLLGYIDDLVSDFAYYDRKGDEDLSIEDLNNAIKNGVVSIDDLVKRFEKNLKDTFE